MMVMRKKIIGPVDDLYIDKPFVRSRDWMICHFGGGSQQSTTSQNSAPWEGQQPFLTGLFNSAQGQYQNYTPQYYGFSGTSGGTPTQTGGSEVAPLNSQETGAINQIGNLGLNGTSSMNAANNTLTDYANGKYLSANNPYFGSVTDQIKASVTPGLMGSFTQGTTDNPNVAYAVSNGLGNAIGNAASQNYETQTGNQLNAASMAPYFFNTAIGGANSALTAGQAQQTQAQNQLSNQVNAYNFYQNLPYSQINQLANLITGQYGMTGTSTTTTPTQSLFGSLFSDRRLKENIRRIGTADNGLPIYAYTFKGDSWGQTHIGFMADEVQKLHPDAVHVDHGSTMKYLKVDYAKAVLPKKEDK